MVLRELLHRAHEIADLAAILRRRAEREVVGQAVDPDRMAAAPRRAAGC